MTQEPQIVTLGPGSHNEALYASAQRMAESAQWKRNRVIVLMPADTKMDTKVVLHHLGLIFPPNNAVYRMLCLGMEVGKAYSSAIESILAHPDLSQWEYVLTIESDNTPPPDGVLKLIKAMDEHPEYACIGGLYWTKGEGGVPQIWGDPKDPVLNFRPQVPVPNTVQECCGTGMGFNLWRLTMFKDSRLRKPWFETKADMNGVGTQDLYFWADARKHGFRCAVDTSCLVGHYDATTGINW